MYTVIKVPGWHYIKQNLRISLLHFLSFFNLECLKWIPSEQNPSMVKKELRNYSDELLNITGEKVSDH